MILRTLASGRRLATLMTEHLATATQLFRAIDTKKIELLEPRDLFAHVVGNHDAGWLPENARLELNTATGWPYNVAENPELLSARIYLRSVEENARHHPYCGVLTSMHIQGFFNGRYGKSAPTRARGPDEALMLERIASLEVEWRRRLAEDRATAPWVEERRLFRTYRLLQLFDHLALQLNLGAPDDDDDDDKPPGGSGRPRSFSIPYIPSVDGGEHQISIRWVSVDRALVDPYPFVSTDQKITFSSRVLTKTSSDAELEAMFEAADLLERSVVLADGAPVHIP